MYVGKHCVFFSQKPNKLGGFAPCLSPHCLHLCILPFRHSSVLSASLNIYQNKKLSHFFSTISNHHLFCYTTIICTLICLHSNLGSRERVEVQVVWDQPSVATHSMLEHKTLDLSLKSKWSALESTGCLRKDTTLWKVSICEKAKLTKYRDFTKCARN